MKLKDKDLKAMHTFLTQAGIEGAAVDKLFQFHEDERGHELPGGGQKEIEQLKEGTRFAAWLDKPYGSFSHMPHPRLGTLVFRIKDSDIAGLIVNTKFLTPENDIINGLAFGYPSHAVRAFARGRFLGISARKLLRKEFKIRTKSLVYHGGTTTTVNINRSMIKRFAKKLGKTEFFYNDSCHHNFGKLYIRTKEIPSTL